MLTKCQQGWHHSVALVASLALPRHPATSISKRSHEHRRADDNIDAAPLTWQQSTQRGFSGDGIETCDAS